MKKCYMLMAVLVILTVSSAVAENVSAENNHPDNEKTVRIATYNMHTGIGTDGHYNLDRLANTIRESGADIIGLQEVDVHWGSRSEFENQIEMLADTLNMGLFYWTRPHQANEKAIRCSRLSKYPIIHS
ncbi:endonuclease/exonuclease/phosphatase family protein [Lentibacillus sp. CBA3610]|uniref:endonuclease/exonuclease/phosphatase family protein n=1 Tax=Lentibacillus sp. CBA3610 TaxID=2518176 RepID=UPI001596020C|nr:endonuclease/exonuclease/phosphatase family protein [Lentibacillus sp. CBA3610]QKY70387.1 hypothetical protein Len3610_12970 [Lentibacillus sp. CBA3610]